jgi:hypothetical protein
MVEGDDRTHRSSACGSSSDYGCQPDGPEEFDRKQGPERQSKSTGDWHAFPAPRLTALDEFRQYEGLRTRWVQPEGLMSCKSELAVPA